MCCSLKKIATTAEAKGNLWSKNVFYPPDEEFVSDLLKNEGEFLIQKSFIWNPLEVSVRWKNKILTFAPFVCDKKYSFGAAAFDTLDELISHHVDNNVPIDEKRQINLKCHVTPGEMLISVKDVKSKRDLKITDCAISSCVEWRNEKLHMKQLTRLVQPSTPLDMPQFQTMDKQYAYLTKLSHENLAICQSLVFDDNTLGRFTVFSEWLGESRLDALLNSSAKLTEVEKVCVCLDVAKALAYLHKHNMVHRHVTPCKVFRKSNVGYKLTGLWWCIFDKMNCNCSEEPLHNAVMPPLKCQSPEVLADKGFTKYSDVWNFGVFVYEVVTDGREPYGVMGHEQKRAFIAGGGDPGSLDAVRKQFGHVKDVCCQLKPADRPFMAAVVEMVEKLQYLIKLEPKKAKA